MPSTCRIYANETSREWNKKCWPNCGKNCRSDRLAEFGISQKSERFTSRARQMCLHFVTLLSARPKKKKKTERRKISNSRLSLPLIMPKMPGHSYIELSSPDCRLRWLVGRDAVAINQNYYPHIWLFKAAHAFWPFMAASIPACPIR